VARVGELPEGEKRMTLTAELWAVPLGARPLWKVAVGSLSSDPSGAIVQICKTERVRKWEAAKSGVEFGGGESEDGAKGGEDGP
jgi:hypothetical protein